MTEKDYQAICLQYCADIKSGKITAGIYTKKAVKRFETDLKRSKDEDFLFFMDWKAARLLCEFAETLKPTDLNGKPLELLSWHVFVLSNLEGWRHKAEPDRKRFRLAYIEVNRKNSKTTSILLPSILYNFLKYPASESYLVSSRDDLSEKTFKEISHIVKADKTLDKILSCQSLAITFRDPTETSRISFFCDGGKDADGFKPRFFCIDEFHAFQNEKMLSSMQYGTRSKKDAQGVIITTADTDINRPCYEQNLKSKRILNGTQSQDDFFCIIYAIDDTDDYHNPKTWQKANPSLYDIIEPSVIQADIDDAELTPHKIPELKAKTFGIWGGGGEKSWLPVEIWQQNKDIEVNWNDFDGAECCGGLDLSQVDDMTAFTLKFTRNNKHFYKHRFFIPAETIKERYRRENINMMAWVDAGIVQAIPGKTLDYDFIVESILEDAERFKLKAIGYDKWQSKNVINAIEEKRSDILLIEIEQSIKKLSPITKDYEKTIKDGFVVDNSPVMLWMINNTECYTDPNGNIKLKKSSKSSSQRIDGVISSLMAHGVSINPEVNQMITPISFEKLKAIL